MTADFATPKLVAVSLFSGMDLFLWGLQKVGIPAAHAVEWNQYAARIHQANFQSIDGKSLITWKDVTPEEYASMEKDVRRMRVWKKKDGTMCRPESIEEVDGHALREKCELLYGKNIVIILIGGPPCQDFTSLNTGKDKGRNKLMFEYLRVLRELQPDVALMEEVPEVLIPKHLPIYQEFLTRAYGCGYSIKYKLMNALLYDGCQSRERCITMMTHKSLHVKPRFPESKPDNAKRAGEIVEMEYFFSGHFTDTIKTGNHWMCTVTSGSPKWLQMGEHRREFTPEELLMYQGVFPEEGYIIPDDIPKTEVKQAIGNAVPANLGYHLGLTVKQLVEEHFQLLQTELIPQP